MANQNKNNILRLPGFTLVEVIIAMAAACIVMLSVAILVSSGEKSWTRVFNTSNSEFRLGSLDSMIALGSTGRKSNKLNYRVYKVAGGNYQRAVPLHNPEEVVTGQAVEFRYWKDPLKSTYMNTNKTADSYALFYLENGRLKVDYGKYDPPGNPGGVSAAGVKLTGDKTITLTTNISEVDFSHTTYNMTGDGNGCVRMKLVIFDPVSGTNKTTIAATYMRNVWPQ
jgi:prepilin-type N-terminal cleavage/methylation domain-containing protein